MGILVFISVLLVAACGLIYELVAGTLASYLVGDSVFQFSTVIGTGCFHHGGPMNFGSLMWTCQSISKVGLPGRRWNKTNGRRVASF